VFQAWPPKKVWVGHGRCKLASWQPCVLASTHWPWHHIRCGFLLSTLGLLLCLLGGWNVAEYAGPNSHQCELISCLLMKWSSFLLACSFAGVWHNPNDNFLVNPCNCRFPYHTFLIKIWFLINNCTNGRSYLYVEYQELLLKICIGYAIKYAYLRIAWLCIFSRYAYWWQNWLCIFEILTIAELLWLWLCISKIVVWIVTRYAYLDVSKNGRSTRIRS
jgi:hypothetical protein